LVESTEPTIVEVQRSSATWIQRDRLSAITERDRLTLETDLAAEPEVARWRAAMQDSRRDTVTELEGITDEMLDARPSGSTTCSSTDPSTDPRSAGSAATAAEPDHSSRSYQSTSR